MLKNSLKELSFKEDINLYLIIMIGIISCFIPVLFYLMIVLWIWDLYSLYRKKFQISDLIIYLLIGFSFSFPAYVYSRQNRISKNLLPFYFSLLLPLCSIILFARWIYIWQNNIGDLIIGVSVILGLISLVLALLSTDNKEYENIYSCSLIATVLIPILILIFHLVNKL